MQNRHQQNQRVHRVNVTQDLFITKEFIKNKAFAICLKKVFPQSCLLGVEVFVVISCKVHASVILKRSAIKGKLALSTLVNDGYSAVTTRKTYFSYENIGWRQRNKTVHLSRFSITTEANFSVSFHSSPLFPHIKLKWFLDFLESIFYFKLWVLDFFCYSCCWCRIKVHADMMPHCYRHASVFHGGIHGWLNISKSIINGL